MNKKLLSYIKQHDLAVNYHTYTTAVDNSQEAAKQAGTNISNIIKTILFKDEHQRLYATILPGKCSVNRKPIKQTYSIKDLTLLSRSEVLQRTGYPAGGVPPFGFEATFLLDKSLELKKDVYAGGGDIHTLIYVSTQEIIRANNPHRMNLTK